MTAREHEEMIKEGVCPRCGGETGRDEVDIGVGIQCGPWGCISGCGWSECEEYDIEFGGGLQQDGSYLDPQGGLWPASNPAIKMMREAESRNGDD